MKKRNTEATANSSASAFPNDHEDGREESTSPLSSANDAPSDEAVLAAPTAHVAENGDATPVTALVPQGYSHQEEWAGEARAHPLEQSFADRLLPLEVRVSRLEDALAHLQEAPPRTPALSAQAVVVPMARIAPTPTPTPTPPPAQPVAMPNLTAPAAALLVAGAQLLANTAPPGSPSNPGPPPSNFSLWLLFDIVAEGRAILRMFTDPRYRLSWFGRVVPIVLLVFYFTWTMWVPLASALPFWVDRIVDLPILFALFKTLSYEARRYRQTAPDLPPSLRL